MTTLSPMTASRAPARPRTPLKRHQWQRNLVMCLAGRHGASPGLLAEAFDLTERHVRRVLRTCKVETRRHDGPQA